MCRAIFFDVDNTLLSFDEYVRESMQNGFKKYHLRPYEEEMFSVFRQINNGMWLDLEKGKMNFEELKEQRWNRIFEALGISFDGVVFEEYFGRCLVESAIPEAGALELLQYLYGRYILCAASNGPYLQQENRLKISGMLPYFSHLFISEEIGASKPSEKFFQICLDRLNENVDEEIQPHEIMMVGDSLSSDIMGGAKFGMQTCFYHPSKTPVSGDVQADYIVSSLEEIRRLL